MKQTEPKTLINVTTIVWRSMRPYLNLDGTYSIQVLITLNGERSSINYPEIFQTKQDCQDRIDLLEATGLITYGVPFEYTNDLPLPRT